jgi:hypothetical protein
LGDLSRAEKRQRVYSPDRPLQSTERDGDDDNTAGDENVPEIPATQLPNAEFGNGFVRSSVQPEFGRQAARSVSRLSPILGEDEDEEEIAEPAVTKQHATILPAEQTQAARKSKSQSTPRTTIPPSSPQIFKQLLKPATSAVLETVSEEAETVQTVNHAPATVATPKSLPRAENGRTRSTRKRGPSEDISEFEEALQNKSKDPVTSHTVYSDFDTDDEAPSSAIKPRNINTNGTAPRQPPKFTISPTGQVTQTPAKSKSKSAQDSESTSAITPGKPSPIPRNTLISSAIMPKPRNGVPAPAKSKALVNPAEVARPAKIHKAIPGKSLDLSLCGPGVTSLDDADDESDLVITGINQVLSRQDAQPLDLSVTPAGSLREAQAVIPKDDPRAKAAAAAAERKRIAEESKKAAAEKREAERKAALQARLDAKAREEETTRKQAELIAQREAAAQKARVEEEKREAEAEALKKAEEERVAKEREEKEEEETRRTEAERAKKQKTPTPSPVRGGVLGRALAEYTPSPEKMDVDLPKSTSKDIEMTDMPPPPPRTSSPILKRVNSKTSSDAGSEGSVKRRVSFAEPEKSPAIKSNQSSAVTPKSINGITNSTPSLRQTKIAPPGSGSRIIRPPSKSPAPSSNTKPTQADLLATIMKGKSPTPYVSSQAAAKKPTPPPAKKASPIAIPSDSSSNSDSDSSIGELNLPPPLPSLTQPALGLGISKKSPTIMPATRTSPRLAAANSNSMLPPSTQAPPRGRSRSTSAASNSERESRSPVGFVNAVSSNPPSTAGDKAGVNGVRESEAESSTSESDSDSDSDENDEEELPTPVPPKTQPSQSQSLPPPKVTREASKLSQVTNASSQSTPRARASARAASSPSSAEEEELQGPGSTQQQVDDQIRADSMSLTGSSPTRKFAYGPDGNASQTSRANSVTGSAGAKNLPPARQLPDPVRVPVSSGAVPAKTGVTATNPPSSQASISGTPVSTQSTINPLAPALSSFSNLTNTLPSTNHQATTINGFSPSIRPGLPPRFPSLKRNAEEARLTKEEALREAKRKGMERVLEETRRRTSRVFKPLSEDEEDLESSSDSSSSDSSDGESGNGSDLGDGGHGKGGSSKSGAAGKQGGGANARTVKKRQSLGNLGASTPVKTKGKQEAPATVSKAEGVAGKDKGKRKSLGLGSLKARFSLSQR